MRDLGHWIGEAAANLMVRGLKPLADHHLERLRPLLTEEEVEES